MEEIYDYLGFEFWNDLYVKWNHQKFYIFFWKNTKKYLGNIYITRRKYLFEKILLNLGEDLGT